MNLSLRVQLCTRLYAINTSSVAEWGVRAMLAKLCATAQLALALFPALATAQYGPDPPGTPPEFACAW